MAGSRTSAPRDWLSTALGVVAVALPVALAAAHARTIGDGAHDLEAVRALGLGFTGGLRALDGALAAPFALLPFGTRALRASLASVACLGLVSALVFELARAALLRRGAPVRLASFVAFVAAAACGLSPALQSEAVAIGGATAGLALILLPRWLLARGHDPSRVALALGLALSYEPLVGLCALACVAPDVPAMLAKRTRWPVWVGALLAGALPLLCAIALRRSTDLEPRLLVHPWGDAWGARVSPLVALLPQTGPVVLGAALGGLGLLVARASSRKEALRSILAVAASTVAIAYGAKLRAAASPVALLALVEVALLAGVGMMAALTFVRETKVPFAKASAWLAAIVLLAIVARQADDASLALGKETGEPARAFARYAWDGLPLGSLALVADRDVALRIEASRAQGDVRADVAFVRLGSAGAMTDIGREAKLAPLLRDQALYGAPEEWSISALASARPVVLTFDARWPRPLARHLIAAGPFDRFAPEPRGLAERRQALDDSEPPRLALTFALERESDAALARVTASILRARLLGAAASGDRDVMARALDDLRPFAPGDPMAFEIVRRMTTTRGPIDTGGLAL